MGKVNTYRFHSGGVDCKQLADTQTLDDAERWTCEHEIVAMEYSQYAEKVMDDFKIKTPQCWNEGLELYFLLLQDFDNS